MSIFDNLKDRIKQHEGCVLRSYNCSEGVATIGYGHAIKSGEVFDEPITEEMASMIFEKDFMEAVDSANSLLPIRIIKELPQPVHGVLIEMCFQLGRTGVSRFKNMLAAIKEGEYKSAAAEMRNSLWATQTPGRAESLAKIMESI